jgi:uncharacterized membrane protein
MRNLLRSRRSSILLTLGLASSVSIVLWIIGALDNHSDAYWYLIWNLVLAWMPIVFVSWLIVVLNRRPWLNWRPMLLTVFWLGFLPNSFYLVTDFIHLQDFVRVDALYDAIMFESFVINGLLLGYLSVYLIHRQLLRRVRARTATELIGLTFLVCSFAIYLGRDLRLSSWDLLVNPASVLFSVSDPIVSPRAHIQAFTLTLTAFVFLSIFYFVAWQLIRLFYRRNEA